MILTTLLHEMPHAHAHPEGAMLALAGLAVLGGLWAIARYLASDRR